jgi:hypothetical protein
MKRTSFLILTALILSLIIPTTVQAARPPKKESRFVTDIVQKALELEKDGRVKEAEEILLELYRPYEGKRFRDESRWLAYMNILRNIISFYYRNENFKEADWYHNQYSDELDEDEEESGMHAMIVYDVMGIAEDLIKSGEHLRAEETFLYLTDRLEARLGYDHWLVRLVYKNIVSLYLRMENEEMALEYNRKLNPEND